MQRFRSTHVHVWEGLSQSLDLNSIENCRQEVKSDDLILDTKFVDSISEVKNNFFKKSMKM